MDDLGVAGDGGGGNTFSGIGSGPVVQAGTVHDGVHFHPPVAREPVGLPFRFGSVPARVGGFQDRAVAGAVAAAVEGDGPAVLTSSGVGVVSGLGGVSKTQLAADYAHRAWDRRQVDLVVWVAATSRDGVVAAYARLAAELTGLTDADAEQGAQRAVDWLASTGRRWLVVLDDVRSPGDLKGLWPPRTTCGRVLVTTRRRDAALARVGSMVEVGLFTPAESAAYLRAVLARRPGLAEGAAELAEALGHLPLALSQAAAYAADRNISCVEYLARFRARRLVTVLPAPDALPDEHQATVDVTWSLSIEAADKVDPAGLAAPLMRLCAVLDPNGIPLSVLTADPVVALLTELTGEVVDAEQARDGLACLYLLNLITLDTRTPHPEVRTHALVQRATREHTPEQEMSRLAHTAADALMAAWPEIERDTTHAAVLRANALALHTTGHHLWHPNPHEVLFLAGNSLGLAGQAVGAREYFTRLRTTATHFHGSDHPGTLATRHNLACWLGEAGDPAGAVTSFVDVVNDHMRVLGPDHPDTLTARHNLAYWRGQAGDPVGAAAATADLLVDRVRVLGPDHPDTLTARHNLARWRGEAGDPVGAAAATADLLVDRVRVLGPDHPDTLATRHNLARWRGRAGDPVGAVAGFVDLLTAQERVLGPDHPHTLTTRHDLAAWRGQAEDPTGAVAGLVDLLADRVRVLGPDHPDTLITRNNLAYWRREAGDPVGAATAIADLLDDQLRVLGPDHLHTLATRHNLACSRGKAGDPAGAATAIADLLTDVERVLGPDHPHTLTTRDNLAHWRRVAEEVSHHDDGWSGSAEADHQGS
ncbi:tetratricopeptide repeat protein [Actinokineospora auranticolor]|uniref:Tetratricopeptide repeat protein n=1 Tax=Actinokineospora auranticolor TaxID=155976 RepID=A0A2S6GM49_9PSEU|nr:tetratricopeptide repeat protein [Actinokineospora auranticolor]PPK66236.1 tetratricopeptide repeat protein [Actinokineospora auranticolor]